MFHWGYSFGDFTSVLFPLGSSLGDLSLWICPWDFSVGNFFYGILPGWFSIWDIYFGIFLSGFSSRAFSLHRFHAIGGQFYRFKRRIWVLWEPRKKLWKNLARRRRKSFEDFFFHETHVFCVFNVFWLILMSFSVIWGGFKKWSSVSLKSDCFFFFRKKKKTAYFVNPM